jgi:alkanesulfonate monooxygenase SsuD/methylene tetrahydromethanopterin reductase-like flavin-dependent oxidoreductase (luciferase family)
MAVSCFISAGKSLDDAVARVRLAEELGYEQVFTTHINGAESLTLITAYALATERIRVGTGVVPIYTRTPATMAQTAATIAALTGDRVVLGVGVSHRPVVEGWYGQAIDKPLAETREYIGKVRAILAGEPPAEGGKWPTGFALAPHLRGRDVPIYNAGLSPKMLTLSGEVADGVILWLCNPHYIRDVVVPTVREGREKAGKELDGFDIVAAVPSAVSDDPTPALDQLRSELVTYFHLPYYRAMIERSGFDPDAGATDEFIRLLAAVGPPEEAIENVRRYRDCGAGSPCVGGISGTDFDATLEALAKSLD